MGNLILQLILPTFRLDVPTIHLSCLQENPFIIFKGNTNISTCYNNNMRIRPLWFSAHKLLLCFASPKHYERGFHINLPALMDSSSKRTASLCVYERKIKSVALKVVVKYDLIGCSWTDVKGTHYIMYWCGYHICCTHVHDCLALPESYLWFSHCCIGHYCSFVCWMCAHT